MEYIASKKTKNLDSNNVHCDQGKDKSTLAFWLPVQPAQACQRSRSSCRVRVSSAFPVLRCLFLFLCFCYQRGARLLSDQRPQKMCFWGGFICRVWLNSNIMLHSAHLTRPTRVLHTHPIPPRTLAAVQDLYFSTLHFSCSESILEPSADKPRLAFTADPFQFILGGDSSPDSYRRFRPLFCFRMFISLCLCASKQCSCNV